MEAAHACVVKPWRAPAIVICYAPVEKQACFRSAKDIESVTTFARRSQALQLVEIIYSRPRALRLVFRDTCLLNAGITSPREFQSNGGRGASDDL